ncbi:protein crumbs isoform X1 [Episyrphus balteatus]|uniref:protein crumbs isoform X1 n=1 Tax=Episyrphus balteatus TaxID=286459 RepID=UPI0024859C49|nr:protein crumbs isoform X1 [Episyrphus balteatus]XP_055854364.1 protein crumbs isoform X1 [Episyrphus balteatus]
MKLGFKNSSNYPVRDFGWLVVFISAYVFIALDLVHKTEATGDSKEAYFNGSAYLRLLTPMPIWGHSAISFRTCRGGEILSQQYNRHTLWLSVSGDFVQVTFTGPNARVDARLPFKLLDNKWHTIQFKYEYGNLNLVVDRSSMIIANSTYNSQFLTNQDVKNEAAILILGNAYSGCLLNGPGLIFNASSMHAQGVAFGACPLAPGPCGDHDTLIRVQMDYCLHDPCMQHGSCISRTDSYECHCTSRYTGKNCEVDTGPPCLSHPCANGGSCQEDERGDYQCYCPPNFTGQTCENEVNVHPLCEKNPCFNNGTCWVPTGTKTTDCNCVKGFTGQFCEINADDCASQPCMNNGRCMDMVNGFSCDCAGTGYSGTLCQNNIDECKLNPCQNGGKCFDTYGFYTCECLPGWGGNNCELSINQCQFQPCQHGGTCLDKKSNFQCICAPGFSGIFCELGPPCPQCPIDSDCIGGKCICKPGTTGPIGHCIPISTPTPQSRSAQLNACSNSVCLNGGTCTGNASNSTCICASGYSGFNCEFPTSSDGCKCLNGGTCSLNGTHCYCPSGFDGDRCEKFEPCTPTTCEDPMMCSNNKCICPDNMKCAVCSSNPCHNGGVCRDKDVNYECVCPEGWNGTQCDYDVDECQNLTICGHGICVNRPGSFKCYCEPGFTGLLCDSDVDECLSRPCKNGASCVNKVNDYECICPAGYTGKECDVNIDECASNPCEIGSTCIDMVNNFTCSCIPGMTGRLCDFDIDDCVSLPCQHNGKCIDELGGFHCDCEATGYTGNLCEINIDECLSNQCTNGAECIDKINDYMCNCFPGFSGKNCEIDINECEVNPCQYNGTCLQRSNLTLYQMADKQDLPPIFSQEFSYENASGYDCICVPGIMGKNCDININECESNPCSKHGTCVDGIGNYTCECDPGFEGDHCGKNIDECDRYTPCVHGTCIDQTNDYDCDCDANWGGKNCSVELVGCRSSPCLNKGICKPYLFNETQHLFNCSCQHGFQGATCEKTTTISMVISSLITVKTTREEGYDINLEFRTTLPNGVLAFGTSGSQNEPVSYILELINGRLNLHSSLLNKWEGVFIGSKLNDSNWHKVFVAINTSHLVLSANDEQAIYPIGSYESANGSQPYFPLTYLGGTIPNLKSYLRHLTHRPTSFVGCMQDIVINGKWIFPDEKPDDNTSLVKIQSGCPRSEQCKPNPCHSNGECKDLWHTFSCGCQRPHLGHTCKYNITAATFGHENTTHSAVLVETNETARRAIRSILDISMFIRTRQSAGQIFYLGSDTRKALTSPRGTSEIGDSYVSAKLHGGELLVKMQFNGTPEAYTVGGNKLDNGYNHLIEVVRNQTLVQVKLNGTEYFRKTLSSTGQLDAQVLYLGGPAPPAVDNLESNMTKEEVDKLYFKGIIQDVQISNGSHAMIVELYPLNEEDLQLPKPFGEVTIDRNSVLKGAVSDDLCRKKPCQHNAECKNTWNDFECTCPKGYKGKFCQDIEFCQLNKCPGNGVCQNLDDGFECITNMTFKGNEKAPLAFAYFSVNPEEETVLKPVVEISYRTKTGGTLLYVQDGDRYFDVAAYRDQVTVQWKSSLELPQTKRFTKDKSDFEWSRVFLRVENGKLEGGWKGWEETPDPSPAFTLDIDQSAFQDLISGKYMVYLGGMPLSDNLLSRGMTSGATFKGCLGEARLGDLILPYFMNNEMYSENLQPRSQFRLNSTKPEEGCVLCFQEDCKNEAVCTNPSEQYACDCRPGYEGDDCSIDIDECLLANCTNNSTCIDKVASFICSCLPGYDGQLCEHNIDECASMPCHNGGNCTDLVAAYHCDCTEDYAGPQCDVLKLVTCADQPCRSGSTCVDGFNMTTGNNFTCFCMQGLQGPLCDVPFCQVEPCQNGGFCLTTEPTPPICQCSIGYTGRFCEIDINECDPEPCQNGGECKDSIGSYSCNCTGTGFEGQMCEIDIDECQTGPVKCGGRGVCMNTRGSFKCLCEVKLCGSECNVLDPCQQQDMCMNGGICVEACTDVADYYCNCTDGFGGKNCSAMIVAKDDGPSTADIAIIVIPVVVILLLIAAALLGTFLVMARNKRATRGTYSPSAQEYCNPRLEMDNVLKPPPEERLI